MVAVIEAGGTKTEARIGNNSGSEVRSGAGINPYFQSDEEILDRLRVIFPKENSGPEFITHVYYYGAGCSHPDQAFRVRSCIQTLLPDLLVLEVNSDLIGAARAVCRNTSGFVGILGTGSNACIYDGKSIQSQMVSFGFWLGDEGSGGYLGKLIFKDWLRNKLPVEFETTIEAILQFPKEVALERIYADPNPNKTIASLARVAIENKNHPAFLQLIKKSLDDYFEETRLLFESFHNLTFHFVGSVAWHLSDEITTQVKSRGYETGKIVSNPSDLLFEYHTEKI
jgi:N-acetylglucosamine kinase-like BadF-type ATPase